MIYLASPFSANLVGQAKLDLEAKRFAEAVKFTLFITAQGAPIFSPIVYYYGIARALKAPGDAAYWESINAAYLRRAEAVFVLHLPGWDQSKGVQKETRLAKELFIPIVHYGPDFQPLPGQQIDIIIPEGQKQ